MPITFKGCGTKYYGEADRRPDGSFVTTNWFVLGYVPLIPLGTVRVRRDHENDMNIFIASADGYLLLEELPLSWRQVLHTYAFALACLAWWGGTAWLVFILNGAWAEKHLMPVMFGYIVVAALPFIWLAWTRQQQLKGRQGKKPASGLRAEEQSFRR